MIVGDIMARHVEFIDADAPVTEAAALMGELDVGALPVGGPETLVGVLTDRDILYRVVAEGLSPAEVTVGAIASRPVIGCGADDSLQGAMDLMAAHSIRRLAVRDAEGRVIGWLTLGDVARRLLVDNDGVQQALREAAGTTPDSPSRTDDTPPSSQASRPGEAPPLATPPGEATRPGDAPGQVR